MLQDPREASLWEEAWQSYRASGAATGDGIDDPAGTPRERLKLLTHKCCTVCGKTRALRAPTW